MNWETLDWEVLDRLRALFLKGKPPGGSYWTSPGDLAVYDLTYAQRIAWKWDAVLDNNARDYRWVQRSTKALRDSTDYYLFVSSISAYKTPTFSYETAGDVRMTPVLENAERFSAPCPLPAPISPRE